MSTAEKLFVQIFDRKNSIIQRVKQQTDSYTQHLASKLLADGITPPPWLWNPSQSSDVQKVLNKEELISEILLPHPQPAVRFSIAQYNKQVVAGDNGELLVGLSKDLYSYNRSDIGDRETIAANCYDNDTRCTVTGVPEQDLSVNSPQDETEARISNIYSVQDQSLARIQRSKSRQKALELRYSGKSEAKSHSSRKYVSVGSFARNRQPLFGSEKFDKVNDSEELVEPCVIRHETFGVGESNEGDNTDQEGAIACSIGKSRRTENEEQASSRVDSLKLDSCPGSIQKDDPPLVQCEEEFSKCADCMNEPPEVIGTYDVTADTCGEARAEDCWVHKEKGIDDAHDSRISQPSSRQQRCSLNEGPEVDISIYSAKEDDSILVQSMQQIDYSIHSGETNKPSEAIVLERTRSTSNGKVLLTVPYTSSLSGHGDKGMYSSCSHKSLRKDEFQRMPNGEAIKLCPDPCNHQQRNTEAVDANELVSCDLVKDPLVNSRSIIDHSRSECLVSKTSDCLTFLSPRQLVFDDSKKCFRLNSENRIIEKSPKKAIDIPSVPQVTSDDFNNTAEEDKSTKADEFRRDSFESTSEEHTNVQLKEYSSHTKEHPSYSGSEIVPLVQNSGLEPQTDATHSNTFESSDLKDHVSWNCIEVSKSTPELQMDEGLYGDNTKSTSASIGSKRKHFAMDYNTGESDLVICDFSELPLANYHNRDLSKSKGLKFGKNSQPLKMGSWPGTKRRKIEDQETDSCSAPPSCDVGMHYSHQTDHKNMNLEKAGGDIEVTLDYASPMNESSNEEMRPKVAGELTEEMRLKVAGELNEEMQSLRKLQNREIASCSGELSEHLVSSSSKFLQVTAPILLSLGKEAAKVSQEFLVEKREMPANLEKDNDEQEAQDNIADTDNLICTERTSVEGKFYLAEDGQLSHYLERSPFKRDLELSGVDQSLPELEGFIIDSPSENEEVEISESQVNFDELVLPRTSLERISILEQICRSASQQALSTEFSSSFKLDVFHKPYQSVPNGLLECVDLTGISGFNDDVDKDVGSNCMEDVDSYLEMPLSSDYPPCPGSQFGWASSPYSSPVGKQWEKMPLHSGSSGKTLGSNPELTCFPIEEDPSVSEENENVCEESDKTQEDMVSSINTSVVQVPLADITNTSSDAPSPLAAADKFLSKGSGNSVTNDARFIDTHTEAKRILGNHGRDKSLDKENDILSLGGNHIKKSESSLNSRFSKINSSLKTSSRREKKKLSEKEPKRNNIVSNVTSFIPMVQQKQAVAQCTGKREIKVKSLEAAEAVKRLEEKRAKERKMRKEALKIERARLDQENLRQLELEKKRKEEERKKKDAEIAAKKRQREVEEKMEKERKRKRLEEARLQQREDRKLRLEKSKQLSVIEANNEPKRSQVLLKETRDNIPLEKPDAKLRSDGFTSHVQVAGITIEASHTSTDSSDHRKATSAFISSPKTETMAVKNVQEKSYEISPYQCSDDDEEEEEEIPNKKFVPSWTSKSNVALALPLQQGIDPDTIFPPDSFCSTEEVLLPRKLLHKQLVT